MKRQAMCATLLAIGSVVGLGAPAGAASAKACDGGDDVVSAVGHESFDVNANGSVCAHKQKDVSPKKHGGSFTTTYYDDRA